MRVVAITEPGRVEVVERPDPRPAEQLVLVRVTSIPICTEYKGYAAGRTGERFGHEAVGEVVEAAGETVLAPGDRVVVQPGYACNDCELCRGGEHIHCEQPLDVQALTGGDLGQASYAQYLLKPAWLLSPVPDGLDDAYAGMALCGLGPTFGALRQMGTREADTVLITGLGPVGLGGVINARRLGARVIAVESQPYRAALALELGAEVVLDPRAADTLDRIRELTDGRGVDMAIDCSGASAAHRLMVDAVRRKGQATFIGEGGEFPLAASRDMIRKGLLLRGNWHYNLDGYAELIAAVEASRDAIDRLITHRFPMSRVAEAWELQASGECGKVLLDPWA